MSLSPLAGKPAPKSILIDVPRLIVAYFEEHPDVKDPTQRVAFGTSGHRGSALHLSFNEDHILAITQAICDYRSKESITGPLFMGMDTHALSRAAFASALEVLAANGVDVLIDAKEGYTPTPVLSHAILRHNQGRKEGLADGIVITPSHNPPEDGGFKYNLPNGGPADADCTSWIENRANTLLENGLKNVKRITFHKARKASTTHTFDFISQYVHDLKWVVDLDVIRNAGLKIGIDALGNAAIDLWGPVVELYSLNLTIVHDEVDPTFQFVSVDGDGKIRMDCSSRYAMAGLIGLKDRFDIAFANDTDADRHGIVTRNTGLLNPNHYLAVAIQYLITHRHEWPASAGIGKTVVSSSMIDRVVAKLNRPLVEVPVGFKWFVDGLYNGTLAFGGEESAGASFLRQDGSVWTTDKDGIILGLLAAEITARTGKDPGEHYQQLTATFGAPVYERIDAPATPEQKTRLKNLCPEKVHAKELAGEPIKRMLTSCPGNQAAIGGLKVESEHGWFAARPSGTEDVYKIYAESFVDQNHLHCIQNEARAIVTEALG